MQTLIHTLMHTSLYDAVYVHNFPLCQGVPSVVVVARLFARTTTTLRTETSSTNQTEKQKEKGKILSFSVQPKFKQLINLNECVIKLT
jgi:hypothetical protein